MTIGVVLWGFGLDASARVRRATTDAPDGGRVLHAPPRKPGRRPDHNRRDRRPVTTAPRPWAQTVLEHPHAPPRLVRPPHHLAHAADSLVSGLVQTIPPWPGIDVRWSTDIPARPSRAT